jgi:AraC-like DNA-binding protein
VTDSRYWQLRLDGSRHRYARHAHEGYAIGVVEAGAHAFVARGRTWTAIPGRVIIVNPEQVHDGGPATRDGVYSYRMMYVDGAAFGGTPFFREPVVSDATLARRIARAHRSMERPATRLEAETLLVTTLRELARRHGGAPVPREARSAPDAVTVAREYLVAHFADECALSELAAIAGVDRFHLLRAFNKALGLPPHRYQTLLRLRQAKRLLREGEPASIAAAAVGFADQSHLIRTFKSAYGVTPGAYVRAVQ